MEQVARQNTMTETEIWNTITNDAPRRWSVFLDGHWFAVETSTAANILADARRWFKEALVWEMNYGTHKTRIVARCAETDEYLVDVVEVTVTPDSGVSTME